MTEKQSKPWRIAFYIAIIVPTLIWLILLPFLPEEENVEKREKAKVPTMAITNYINIADEITAFYDDRLPFRTALISLNSYGIYKVFHEAGMPYVVVGKGNWLFYDRKEDGNNILDYKGLAVFSDEHRDIAMGSIAYAKDTLAKRGCDFIMLIVPEKDHVYNEFMPDYIYGPGPSRAEAFIPYVEQMTGVPIVYPRAEFQMYKEELPENELYFHYDTHWNALGAYIGVKTLLDEMGMESTPIWELKLSEEDNSKYDLAKLLSINAFVHDDVGYRIEDPNAGKVTVLSDDEDTYRIMHYKAEGPNVDPRRVLVIRDSFGTEMAPYLASHFSETWLIHRTGYAWMMMNDKLPEGVTDTDLVILELSERYLPELMQLLVK